MAAVHDQLRQHYEQQGGHLLHLINDTHAARAAGKSGQALPSARLLEDQGNCAIKANKEGTCTRESRIGERGLAHIEAGALVVKRSP